MKLCDFICSHLEQHTIEYQRDDDGRRIEFIIAYEDITIPFTIRIFHEDRHVLFYAFSPIRIPESKRLAAAEFLMRANYGLRFGNFEMDLDDGEVRFKVALDLGEAELNDSIIRNCLGTALSLQHRYHSGLMTICFAESTPREEIYRIEEG